MASPVLNWKEIAELSRGISPLLDGAFLDRVIVPERHSFPSGYLKGEWALRFTTRRGDRVLVIGIRPRKPYIYLIPDKGPKASMQATRSVFDLTLGKTLGGARLMSFETLPRERVALLRFRAGAGDFGLFLFLIPSAPEAVLAQETAAGGASEWRVVASTRKAREAGSVMPLPDGSRAPADMTVRAELVEPERYREAMERDLQAEAFDLRVKEVDKKLREDRKLFERRLQDFELTRGRTIEEPDWQKLGDLLKAQFHSPPPMVTVGKETFCEVMDYETGSTVRIPCDPKLDVKGQLTRLYNLARRKKKRMESTEEYAEEARRKIERVDRLQAEAAALAREATPARDTSPGARGGAADGPAKGLPWKKLESLESSAGLVTAVSPMAQAVNADKRRGSWPGRSFLSKDKLPIWVGRSSKENLELVFKYAKGNDVWLHVRGRASAHVLVPLPAGKTAPLETLLDAAHLCIHFSGGTDWGKTDVDYTFRKHLKRIKNSTEVSYTGNKTLTIDPDRERLKRLLEQEKS